MYPVLALLVLAGFTVFAANQASAASTYYLVKTSTLSASPAVGWSTCQSKYVTLPKLSTSDRYSWGEYSIAEDGLEGYNQTFAGTYYWTVCIASMKGINVNWTYQVYSLLTLANSTCETTGHCTEYELQHHYIRVDVTTSGQWGSRLQAYLPATAKNRSLATRKDQSR